MSAASERGKREMKKVNQRAKAQVGAMRKGSVGSKLKKDISTAMGNKHRVG